MNKNFDQLLSGLGTRSLNKLVYVLALISLLLSCSLVLSLIIIYNYSLPVKKEAALGAQAMVKTVPKSPSFSKNYTTFSFNPISLSLNLNQTKNLNMLIDTGQNTITGVQFTLKYDPKMIEIVSLSPAGFYEKPTVLLSKKDPVKGIYEYALGSLTAKSGNGNLVTLIVKGVSKGSTQINFLGETKVADKNETSNNVFKKAESVSVNVL